MVVEATPIDYPNTTEKLIGTLDYYEAVLREVNRVRVTNGYARISELPRARLHGSYTGCAVGMCFKDVPQTEDVEFCISVCNNSPILRHYERAFEFGMLAEVEPI